MPATLSYRTHTLVAWRAVVEATGTIDGLLLCDGDDVDVDAVEAHGLEQVLGLLVDVELAALRVVREVEGGYFGHVLILALALFFLQLEGDAADGTALDTLHQVGCEAGDLVAKALGGNDGNFIANTLVGLEVERELWVVPLNDDLGGLLDSLRSDATHFGGDV